MAVRAGNERQERESIVITRNDQFDRAHGVRSGSGTADDPYVISGWILHHIEIADTSKAVRIVDNAIQGTLRLNWIGPNVLVRGNDIFDLRVNENVERTGAPTSGRIVDNTFEVVGQLRHFDGMFMHNTVGRPGNQDGVFGPFSSLQAVNFDGFNGAHFAHNTIYGYVETRLHGHHHSSSYGDTSHMHTATKSHKGHHGDHVDHTQRFHQVVMEHNTIYASGPFGLLYVDTNHAGNDRRAASETDPDLELPHVHHTKIHVLDNTVIGAGITVDIFNAEDELHERFARGLMHIEGNDITLEMDEGLFSNYVAGIQVWQARNMKLRIVDNRIEGPEPSSWAFAEWWTSADGLVLDTIDVADVTIKDLRISDVRTGVRATQMTERVEWTIQGLRTRNVDDRVQYDQSVANEPS